MHISDELVRHAFDASDGLAEPIEVEIAVADCDPEPIFTAAMVAWTPKGEKILKPMGLVACRRVFEDLPIVQATFELRVKFRRALLRGGCLLDIP
jgi:hypothetical protein